ncbi:MAG: cytochrome P450 [Sphingomonadales bacterium]|nr:cytochrome P450 [Sphingomonadales bacterium]
MTEAATVHPCPHLAGVDHRKTAAIAAANDVIQPGAARIGTFATARAVFRSGQFRQAMLNGDRFPVKDPSQLPVFFLDGDLHRAKRAALAKFFSPRAINTLFRPVIDRETARLLASFRQTGRMRLDEASWFLAVAVAAEVVGLGESPSAAMAGRIEAIMVHGEYPGMPPLRRFVASQMSKLRTLAFYLKDVRPAIIARRKQRREDLISQLLDDGFSEVMILVECMVYATAGMTTTREFITMACWHLFDHPDLRDAFVNGDEREQFAILEEILRLEPVGGYLYRRADEAVPDALRDHLTVGQTYALDVRAANTDEAATGPCPYALDPGRAARMKENGSYMAFGDGPHRCPGAQVALHETRVFVDALFKLPGLRLETPPRIEWNRTLMSYELRDCIVTCAPG